VQRRSLVPDEHRGLVHRADTPAAQPGGPAGNGRSHGLKRAEGRITIGDHAALNSFCRLFGHGGIDIGQDTQIGPGSPITTTEHDSDHDLATHFKRVRIGKGVWIGANITILPGVEIGDFTVIGAGSLVMKTIPARCTALGFPARVVKFSDAPSGAVPSETHPKHRDETVVEAGRYSHPGRGDRLAAG
jgi:acetyltransferase-like isoleucine patch superfamily enzyme